MFDSERYARLLALHTHPRVIFDFETRSELDIRDVGAWVYAEHHSTVPLCLSYKVKNPDGTILQPTRLWRAWKGEPLPPELIEYVEKGYVFEAHNAFFELAICVCVMLVKYGMPVPKYWADTMAACAYRSLPMDLGDVGNVLNLETKKDKRGKELIRKLCGPQKLLKKDIKEGKTFPNYCNDETLLEELGQYCVRDSDTEDALGVAIKDLPDDEYILWCLDQQINRRGVRVDVDALKAAAKIRDAVFEKLLLKLREITGGAVQTADERVKIIEWADKNGVYMEDMTADTVTSKVDTLKKWLKDPEVYAHSHRGAHPTPEQTDGLKKVLAVLKIRQTLGKTSTKKIDKFLETFCKDHRIRGLLQYHGAGTGRWAGRLVQPQNFPRPDEDLMWQGKAVKHLKIKDGMERLLEVIRTGDADLLEIIYGDPMDAMASALRGFIIAEDDAELYVSDFSAIEARVLAWIAGETWKLEAFAAIDRKEGYNGSQDIYLATASMVYGYPCLTKDSHGPERQTGKTCELAFGYQGGVGAWRKFDDSDKWTDEQVDEKKNGWRNAHPMVVRLWYGLEEAAVKAVQLQKTFKYRDIIYSYVKSPVGPWLVCKLPNGRCLWYFNPQLEENGVDRRTGQVRYQVSYEGRDNKKGGSWGRVRTYGGMLTENVVQAVSRDLMVDAMFRVERAGYPIILTVHDEIICERKRNTGGDMKEFNALMAELPEWVAKHPLPLPIGVAGYRSFRYKKD